MKKYRYDKDEQRDSSILIDALKEQEDRLKFAIWDHMEFLNKVVGMDVLETFEIVDDITISAYLEYNPEEEYFEE